jgi:hypothetical protein
MQYAAHGPADKVLLTSELALFADFPADAPGFAFDGSRSTYPNQAIAALDQVASIKTLRERPIEIELTPIPAVSPKEADA